MARFRGSWLVVAGAAGLAVALTLRATSRFGPGAEPDTVTYLAAAHHLRAGDGFGDIDGSPLTLFPPVFPAAVAGLEWFGLAPLSAARILNAVMLGVLVVLAAVWARRISGSPALGAIVAVVVAVATPMVTMASNALSEPVGIVAVVACLLFLTEALRADDLRLRWPVLAGLAAAMACLTRYASIVLFPVGVLALVARPGGWRARIRSLATFLAAGGIPLAAWLARNVAAAGNATGDGRGTSALGLFTSLKLTLASVGAWVLPGAAPVVLRATVGAVLCVAVAGGLWLTGARSRPALPVALFVVLGVGSVALFEWRMAIDPPPRFLLPVFIPLVVGAALIGDEVRQRWQWRPGVTAIVVLAVVAASMPGVTRFVLRADRYGLLDYSTPAWRSSPTLAYLRAHPVQGIVASDDPYVLDLDLGIPAEQSPARTYYASNETTGELPAFVQQVGRAGAAGLSVVWFPRSYQSFLYSLADLERAVCLRVEQHFADGDLLRPCTAGT
jgi:hypothetical protein